MINLLKKKTAIAQINCTTGALKENAAHVEEYINLALKKNAQILIFPKNIILGVNAKDLYKNHKLLAQQEKLQNDMENYAIDVHSLKSDCKYLGFYDLADVAYEHELKSKENDSNFVNENFERLANEYLKVLNIVKEYKDRLK